VHGDYRIGNFLFDENSGGISAILDWELAHLGDYHEDVAGVLSPVTMVFDGVWRASDLFEREEWLDSYQEVSGLPIVPKTLRYYEILTAYKTYVTVVGTAIRVANASHSHQNILLITLSALGPGLLAQICDLFEGS
jgi:aminoglycoside phosphotransferase (APT) family kinase protein